VPAIRLAWSRIVLFSSCMGVFPCCFELEHEGKMAPLKILMTGSEWFGTRAGGLNRYFTDLYDALLAKTEVEVIAAAFGTPPASLKSTVDWGEPTGGTLTRVRTARRNLIAHSGDGFDIVDSHFALYAPPVGYLRSVPRVVHFHGPWAMESKASGRGQLEVGIKHVFEGRNYRNARHFVVLSLPFAELLMRGYGVRASNISVIPPGVDLHRFTPKSSARVSSERPTVLCVRRLERRMGIDHLIRAWDAVVGAVPDAQLRIVGTGTENETMRAQAALSARPDSIVFTGRLSDAELVSEYARSTLTVVPSVELEGFGLIALESLAAGRAPIVTDCGGLPDAVRGLDESLIIERASSGAISGRVLAGLRGEIPSAAECVRHVQQFSWANTAARHLDLYRQIHG
jgi:glycosyltransferase involved in cell wall biosynthesis